MAHKRTIPFNPKTFLSIVGSGKTILKSRKKQIIFSQGDPADAVFYIQEGKVKLTVISQKGKEAVVAILGRADFLVKLPWQGSLFASRPLPPWKIPRSFELKKTP